MRFTMLGLFSACALLLGGCSTSWQYVKAPSQELKVADASKARIYLIRPDSGSKMASTRISDNGVLIGNTGPRGYLCWEREPGTVKVTSLSAGQAETELTVDAGGVYYLLQRVNPGFVYGKSSLTILPAEEGIALLQSCKPAYFTDAKPFLNQPRATMDYVMPFAGGGGPFAGGGGAGGIGIGTGSGGSVVWVIGGR
jgi:hypothetical protein